MGIDLSINFDFFLIFKIDTQIHTQKLEFFTCILNYLIRNLQEICKNTQTQNIQKIENSNPEPFGFFGCICLDNTFI